MIIALSAVQIIEYDLHFIKIIFNFVKQTFNFTTMTNHKMPTLCPSCGETLKVETLRCEGCDTLVKGSYALPRFMRLTSEEQEFLLEFIECSGSLKELAARRSLSYPTVRNMLDNTIDHLKNIE